MQAASKMTVANTALLSTSNSSISASRFHPPIGTAGFSLSFLSPLNLLDLFAFCMCYYPWIFQKWLHPLLSVYIMTATVDPDRGFWGLCSTLKHYFCFAYLPETTAATSRTDPGSLPFLCLPRYRAAAWSDFLILTFRCWSQLVPCVSHLSLFLNWSEKRLRISVAHCNLKSSSWWLQWRLLCKNWWEQKLHRH